MHGCRLFDGKKVPTENTVMNIDASKVLAIEITSTFIILPLILWLTLYVAFRWWSINPRPVLPWLRTLRWLGWGFGIVLLLVHLANDRFPFA
jgi:hypothetical protein